MRLSRYRKWAIASLMLGTSAIALVPLLKSIAVWLFLFAGAMFLIATVVVLLEVIHTRSF